MLPKTSSNRFRLRADIREALDTLPAARYKTIYLDPPWAEIGGGAKYKRGADRHYATLSQKELRKLDVGRIAAENAHLYLWVTNNFLEDGLELLKVWGFEYRTMITWGKNRFGLGQYFRGQTEHVLFGVRGVLPYKIEDGKRQQGTTLLLREREKHSKKPREMRKMIEKVSYAPFVELFARKCPSSWDAIGLELK